MIGRKQLSVISYQLSVINNRLSVETRKTKAVKQSEIQNPKSKIERGFTLLEMMITMFIIIILLSVALPTYQRSVQQARENVLKQNLDTMRRAIQQYGADKGKLPQSIDDLVTNQYLSERPIDPVTEKTDWSEITGDDINSSKGEQGLKNVKSNAEGEDGDGVKFQDY